MIGELAAALDSERAQARTEIERLRQIIGTLQRDRFGRRSERLHDDQLQLGLEDLDADIARVEAKLTPPAAGRQREASAPRMNARASPIIYRAMTCLSTSALPSAQAVAGPFIRSARRSARCWTTCRLACACCASAGPNTAAGAVGRCRLVESGAGVSIVD